MLHVCRLCCARMGDASTVRGLSLCSPVVAIFRHVLRSALLSSDLLRYLVEGILQTFIRTGKVSPALSFEAVDKAKGGSICNDR